MDWFEMVLGDCHEVLNDLPAGTVDCVLTDPPYGVTKLPWDRALDWSALWPELHRITAPSPRLWHPDSEVCPSRVQIH